MSLYQDPVALEEVIISACDSHERKNGRVKGYRRCIPFNGYFVKFGDYSSLNPARLTQEHLAGLAKADKRAPHVPEIYHFFHRDERMAYVVMENIQTVEVSTPDLVAKTAEAVLWMRSVAAPSSVVLGPLGRGRARHAVFKDFEAPLHFTSVQALERYLNMVRLVTWDAACGVFPSFLFPAHTCLSTRPFRSSLECHVHGTRPQPLALLTSRWSSPSLIWTLATSVSILKADRASSTPMRLDGFRSLSLTILCCQLPCSPPVLPHSSVCSGHLNWVC